MKDLHFSEDMQFSMAVEAGAERAARANVLSAKGEAEASRALRDAGDELGGLVGYRLFV